MHSLLFKRPALKSENVTDSKGMPIIMVTWVVEFLSGDRYNIIKFIYSEKATNFCKLFTLLLSYVVPVKSKVKILKNFVAFSKYMNFTIR